MPVTDGSKTLSPRDLAVAIGMSESSLKRWVDRGLLESTRTAGGHRRIRVKEAVRFIRDRQLVVSAPEKLGLSGPVTAAFTERTATPTEDSLYKSFVDYLEAGEGDRAEALLLHRFLSGESIAELGDLIIRPAMEELGHGPHGPAEIVKEHRATQICLQSIEQMRVMSSFDEPEFRAVGGGSAGNAYLLPTLLAAGVVEECGGRAINLGANTPARALRCEALPTDGRDGNVDFVWLSISEPINSDEERRAIVDLVEDCIRGGVHFMLGGRSCKTMELDGLVCEHFTVHPSFQSMHAILESAGVQRLRAK